MVLLLSTVKVGCKDARRTQVWNNLFSYICCVIGASITTRDKRMSVDDISLAAYTKYVALVANGLEAIVKSNHGLFKGISPPILPEGILERATSFLTEKVS